jgi:hypothetical protein
MQFVPELDGKLECLFGGQMQRACHSPFHRQGLAGIGAGALRHMPGIFNMPIGAARPKICGSAKQRMPKAAKPCMGRACVAVTAPLGYR